MDEINRAADEIISLTPTELESGFQHQVFQRCDTMLGCLEVLASISKGPALTSEEDDAIALASQCESAQMPTEDYQHPGYLEPEVGGTPMEILLDRQLAEQDKLLGSDFIDGSLDEKIAALERHMERKELGLFLDLTASPMIFEQPSPAEFQEDDMVGSPSVLGTPEVDMAGSPSQLETPDSDNKAGNPDKKAKVPTTSKGHKAKAACKKPAAKAKAKGKKPGNKADTAKKNTAGKSANTKNAAGKSACKKKDAGKKADKTKDAGKKAKSDKTKKDAACKRQKTSKEKEPAEKIEQEAKKDGKMDATAVLKAKLHCVFWLHVLTSLAFSFHSFSCFSTAFNFSFMRSIPLSRKFREGREFQKRIARFWHTMPARSNLA